ncbi:peroxiredoxin-like protein [Spathaspora passalidarum NRRL Y-27907]|uniref:Peroxiredoxin-like protein n=1 Tax=Spathaspora passalidarum (strain NRRL Y-27907 / 11-Y1) TaxID=619300 RepID=G3AUV8_SPAPN|nr:peroxiredoxin-like protein [Spathaspora passalidarum NRRL Y-27907]EGW30049.1 peroxiredoxin-like protein [Spathaspora passalidarum NRRL Y-27907]
MSLTEGQQFPDNVEFTYIPIQLDDLALINPLKCDTSAQLKVDELLTKLSTTDTPNLLIVSVPGAFTPTCTEVHIPQYLENLPKLTEAKVGALLVLAFNDAFVVNAWGKVLIKEYVKQSDKALPQVIFASDGGFSGAHDLAADRGGVLRNKRYATVVNAKDRTIKYLGVEVERGVHNSGLDAVLSKL